MTSNESVHASNIYCTADINNCMTIIEIALISNYCNLHFTDMLIPRLVASLQASIVLTIVTIIELIDCID